MKAAVVCANEDVRYMDYEEPVPGPGEVKVRVMASGICGSDIPRVLNHGVHFYPIVLGHEFSGYVTEVGEGVTKVKAGDHVTCAPLKPCMKCDDCQNGNFSLCKHYSFIGSREQGSNADYVVIPEQNAIVFDPSIPYEEAAMFEPATVAIHGLYQNDYQGGQYVAILGGGTVGMFTMQWAKIFGSKKVVVFDISEARLELAKQKKTLWRKRWRSQAERDTDMYSRQPGRCLRCRWHLSLRQIKHMSALSELLTKRCPLHRISGNR